MLIQPSVPCIQSTSVSFMIKSKVTWSAQSLRVFLTSQSRYEASRLWQFSVFSGVTVRPLALLPRPPTDCSPPLNKYTSTTEKKRARLKLTTDTIWYKSLHSATTAHQSFILLKNNWKKEFELPCRCMRQGRTWWVTCHLQAQCPLRCGTRSPARTRHWMEQPPYSPCPCSTETELHPEREWTSCSQKSEEQKEVMRILLFLIWLLW